MNIFHIPLLAATPYILIPLLLSLVDFVTIIRSKLAKTAVIPAGKVQDCDDFTILIPIFGDMRYLRNLAFLSQYPGRVLLCTTTKERPEFNAQIEALAKQYHFAIYRSQVPISSSKGASPNPWRLFTSTLQARTPNTPAYQEAIYTLSEEARDEIMRESSRVVTTAYSIFIDGDTTAEESLYQLVGFMKQKDFDLASVRVLASRSETIIEKLQSVEYELAMDARRIYPWLTSGAAMIAKTNIMKEVMGHHSLFFSGGDIEIGKLAKMVGYKVGHIAFTFYTDVPRTFRAWVRQRMIWFGGEFRHAVVNAHQYTWRHPLYFFYSTFLVYLLTPIRWYEVIEYPLVIPVVVVLYLGIIFLFHWKKAKPFYLLFPLYALFQVMILVPLGVYTYFKMAFSAENTGIIKLRDHD